jgi:Ca-activated chloride channel family protein
MRRSPRSTALAAALVLAAVAAACSSGDEGAGPSGPGGTDGTTTTEAEPRLDIDPRSYFEDYRPEESESAAGAAPQSSPAPAAPDAMSSAESGGAADSSRAAPDGSAPAGEVAGDDVIAPPPVDPGIGDDNTFVDPGANPFVATSAEPLSTFGLDVDTGSYAVARTFLDQGQQPPPESVRTEEWVNAFGYGDPAPADDAEGAAADLAVTVDGGPAPFATDGTQLVRVGVQARPVAEEDRPDANLTFVVDTSGSMDIRERLGLVRSTLALLALELRDTDTVSVVTYGDTSNVLLPPTPAAEAESIVAILDDLVPQGSTNMEAGLRAGYEQARAAFRPEAINTVVLASDGVANAGITGTDPLSELVRTEGQDGIRLVTVGYGMGNYNDDLMEQLADRGDGFYSYVDTYEEAERLFTGELTSTLTVVAEEARAQVAFDPAAVESYRQVGYENRAIADDSFRDDSVDTGEVGAGHAVTALYEVRLVEDGPDELGTVTLRHRPVAAPGAPGSAGEPVEQEVPITASALATDAAEAPDDVRLAGAVAAFAELLGQHPVSAERGVTLAGLAALVDDLPGATSSSSDGDGDDGDGDGDGSARPDAAELAELVSLATGAAPPGGGGGGEPEPLPRPGPVPTVTTG